MNAITPSYLILLYLRLAAGQNMRCKLKNIDILLITDHWFNLIKAYRY